MADTPDLAHGIPADSLKPGTAIAGTYEGDPVIVARAEDGAAYALDGECTHAGAPLETGLLVESQIRCPWHHARFALATGEAQGGPAVAPLGCYTLAEDGGTLRVTGRREITPVARDLTVAAPVVIVGAGAAGYALADKLALAGHGDKVVLIGAEDEDPYERTLLSKEYLNGAMEREECFHPAPGQDQAPPPEIRLGTTIAAIDRRERQVTLAGGGALPYGTLVLATGARPVQPDFPGAQDHGVFYLRDFADADRLKRAMGDARSVAILGGSFIGLEVAAALASDDREVTVIDRGAVPLAQVLGEDAGRFVQGLHRDRGVEFRTGASVERYAEGTVTLEDGSAIAADILVVGIGVEPRTDLARAAGLTLDGESGGVEVDAHLATSDPAIYALGDIAAYPDPRSDARLRIEHWVHAQRMGHYLARLFTGQTEDGFGDTPFFWTRHYDTSIAYVGHAAPEDPQVEGDVAAGDFAIRFGSADGPRALVTCGRDIAPLEAEREWEKPSHA